LVEVSFGHSKQTSGQIAEENHVSKTSECLVQFFIGFGSFSLTCTSLVSLLIQTGN
jgi:hypothetical protein